MKLDNSIMISITLPLDLYDKMEKKRGDISRSRFVMRAIEQYLKND